MNMSYDMLEHLESDAKKKIFDVIASGKETMYIARFPYKPDENTFSYVWLIIEPEISEYGVGWVGHKMIVPCQGINVDVQIPPPLEGTPIIDLKWTDLDKMTRDSVIRIGSL